MGTRLWAAFAVGLIVLVAGPGGRAAPQSNDTTAEQRPTNITPPVVTGRPAVGETLSTSNGEWQSGLPTTYAYQWQRCGPLDQPGANVALDKPATASAYAPDHPPHDAVDGNLFSYWSAFSPPQWFEVDLLAPYPLNKIRLAITQLPDGFTVHRVLVKGPQPGDSYRELVQFSGGTVDQQVLEWSGAGSWVDGVQFVRIETSTSPSWVAWREVETYTNCADVATGTTYTLARSDAGYAIRAIVIATSAAGSTAAASAATEQVRLACLVPRLVGRKLTTARRLLIRAHCRVGRVRRTHSRRIGTGRVIAQTPRAGTQRPPGTRVNLVVSSGRRPAD
jgi:PASTA domain/F5/8 type C domain